MNKKLAGSAVLLLREKAGPEKRELELLGARVVHAPVVALKEARPPRSFFSVNGRKVQKGWILFTSASGVEVFAGQIRGRLPSSFLIGCVGPSTAKALRRVFKRKAHFMPSVYTTEALGHQLPIKKRENVFLVRSGNADERLDKILAQRGARVRRYTPYILDGRPLKRKILMDLSGGRFTHVFFGARSQVEAFFKGVKGQGSRVRRLFKDGKLQALAIGPETAKALNERGIVCQGAQPHTFEGLINLMVRLWKQ